ncbi:MAG: class I SAM-dependent methyltransferase, partial [Gammaproteobacteria bacterium]
MSDIERQRAHFEKVSYKYYCERKNSNHLLLKKLMWDEFFSGKDIFFEGMRVLEPMCGFAEGKSIIEQYFPEEFHYEGFDYSKTLVELARQDNPDLNIQWGDITRYRRKNSEEKFDLVILIGGLHHVFKHVDIALKNITEALNPGGYFINFEPSQNFLPLKLVRSYLYKRNSLFDEETEQGFDLDQLNHLFMNNGYTI